MSQEILAACDPLSVPSRIQIISQQLGASCQVTRRCRAAECRLTTRHPKKSGNVFCSRLWTVLLAGGVLWQSPTITLYLRANATTESQQGQENGSAAASGPSDRQVKSKGPLLLLAIGRKLYATCGLFRRLFFGRAAAGAALQRIEGPILHQI